MRARAWLLVVAVFVLMGAPPAAIAGQASRPNIVVIYMDDVSPHDGRLWSDPTLTPTLYNYFVARGLHFQNSVGETPLCCPGRAGLLTGLHTHNHGVISNNALLFHPGMNIGKAMKDAGYASMYIGKYLNKNNRLSAAQWTQHGAGWTYLDAIKGWNGAFYNYTVHTKTGNVRYPTTHSTQMVAERAKMRFQATPAGTPIFAVLSPYNLHKPNVPMPQFANDHRCDSMPRYKPPNYNEADVSDKPPWVQSQPLMTGAKATGWPMVGFCHEMLGIDWLAKQVIDELAVEGRLDNTLLVFTADNGMTWGIHRIGQHKLTPYAAPVPLYMSWKAKWGTDQHEVTDAVSNIDLAPTFCALAGSCHLGPYPTGQTDPDGTSLLPILNDPGGSGLARKGVLESAFNGDRKWHAIRTSPDSDIGFWHYVEWFDGSRELYDLNADPFELTNQASNPAYATVKASLKTKLANLWAEGRTSANPGAF